MAGIYIHIPYCVKKCPYCDFVSYVSPAVSQDEYTDALCTEVSLRCVEAEGIKFDTVYIGGGTPSLLTAGNLAIILEHVRDSFQITDQNTEISIEANPKSTSLEWLEEIRDVGINRISVGVQDFSERGLRTLERPHSVEDAYRTVSLALAAGFETVNLDMMFGIPGQSLKELENSLASACGTGVSHISCYELTVENGTRLESEVRAGNIVMSDPDLLADMTDLAESFLARQGYSQYEISNFAIPGHECRHNLNYWANRQYIGLGCSAVSFTGGVRSRNLASLRKYVKTVKAGKRAMEFREQLDPAASFRESIILGLRTTTGVSCQEMEMRFGMNPMDYYGEVLDNFLRTGLVKAQHDMIQLTQRGRRVANSILSALV